MPPLPTTSRGRATRGRIVHAATALVRERGVAALTLDDVQAAAGVGRSQIYHYFTGRDDLLRAVVDTSVAAVLGGGGEPPVLDTLDGIEAWFTRAERLCAATGGVGGCPIGSLVGQLAEQDEGARAVLVEAFDRWQAPLSAGIGSLQEAGVLGVEQTREQLAEAIMAALQGGLLLAQVRRDPRALRHALDGARLVLAAAGAAPRTTHGMTAADVWAAAPESVRGLLVSEYDALVAGGLLDGEPVQLLEGVLVRMAPQSPGHSEAVHRATRSVVAQLPAGWTWRNQAPLVAGDHSEPEPDLAVVRDEDYSGGHPRSAALVVEVARSSRGIDLNVKARVYAASGVPEYWVLDLANRCLYVHRGPGANGYDEVVVHEGGVVTSAGEPSVTLDVDAVLPTL